MLSPILLGAAGGFGLLAVDRWPVDRPLAGALGLHAGMALLLGTGLVARGAGPPGVVGLVAVQVLFVAPTLYCAWRAEGERPVGP